MAVVSFLKFSGCCCHCCHFCPQMKRHLCWCARTHTKKIDSSHSQLQVELFTNRKTEESNHDKIIDWRKKGNSEKGICNNICACAIFFYLFLNVSVLCRNVCKNFAMKAENWKSFILCAASIESFVSRFEYLFCLQFGSGEWETKSATQDIDRDIIDGCVRKGIKGRARSQEVEARNQETQKETICDIWWSVGEIENIIFTYFT